MKPGSSWDFKGGFGKSILRTILDFMDNMI